MIKPILKWSYNSGEGSVKFPQGFDDLHIVTQLDALQDWLVDLGDKYNSLLSETTQAENAAGAQLMYAAPDLLDALQRVMRHIPDNAGGASLSDDMHRAKKAIAKATGA